MRTCLYVFDAPYRAKAVHREPPPDRLGLQADWRLSLQLRKPAYSVADCSVREGRQSRHTVLVRDTQAPRRVRCDVPLQR